MGSNNNKSEILIVDDDNIVLFLHDLMIRESDLSSHPLSFENGKTALDYLKQHYEKTGNYLIFLDINMPVMNGWEFLEMIGELGYKVSVVIVSSSIDSADIEKAKSYKVVKEYAAKPLTIETCVRIRESYILSD